MTERDENNSFKEFQSLNLDEGGSFLDENSHSASLKPTIGSRNSRILPSRSLNLPKPSRRVQSIMNHLNQVQSTSAKYQNCSSNSPSSRWNEPTSEKRQSFVADSFRERTSSAFHGMEVLQIPRELTGLNLSGNIQTTETISDVPTSTTLLKPEPASEFCSRKSDETTEIPEELSAKKSAEELQTVTVSSEVKEEPEEKYTASIQQNATPLFESKEISVNHELFVEKKKGLPFGVLFEISCGLLLGLGLVILFANLRNPIEKRVFQAFQESIHAEVSSEETQSNFAKTEFLFENLKAISTEEQEHSADFTVQKTALQISPVSQISHDLHVNTITMEGVEFPNLAGLELQDAWRPTPIAPLFSDEVKKVLSTPSQALESLRYIEDVKSRYLPQYKEFSAKVKQINTEVEKLQASLQEKLGFKEWNPEILKSDDAKKPEIVTDLKRLGELRKEAIEIQTSWMKMNQGVAQELAQMKEKIALDGKAFSSILHYEYPTEKTMNEYLFQTDLSKRVAETLAWEKALSRMVEMGILVNQSKQSESLRANGSIELFGQPFQFASTWKTNIEENSNYSYCGNLNLGSMVLSENLLKESFLSLACNQKSNVEVHTISARIPLVNDAFVWGDFASLPLYGHAEDSTITLDLTVFGEEVRGKILLEMNQVTFDPPGADAEKANVLYTQFEGKVLPKVLVSAQVTGTASKPIVKCTSPVSAELLPLWAVALQQIHQKTRKETIAAIYEQLKNAETAFNGQLEPFYQEIQVCTRKTDLFKDFPMLKGTISANAPFHEALVEIEPMNLAHLEVDQEDLNETIPTYNPNIGITEKESVSARVGTKADVSGETSCPAAETKPGIKKAMVTSSSNVETKPAAETKPTVKKVPVKKVAEIEPVLPELPLPSQEEIKPEIKTDVNQIPAPTAEEKLSSLSTSEPLVPNVADPVLYSSQSHKQNDSLDVTTKKKSSMPRPMGKSTSHFGS